MDIPTICISVISIIISICSLVYTVYSNRDKFVIFTSERKAVLEWYEKTNKCLKMIVEKAYKKEATDDIELLAELSSQIEVGRFYFPNLDRKDGRGANKPLAYRGNRNAVLAYLVYFYDIAKKENSYKYIEHFNVLQREFTSTVFRVLEPKKYIEKLSKNSYLELKNDVTLPEFLKSNADEYVFVRQTKKNK